MKRKYVKPTAEAVMLSSQEMIAASLPMIGGGDGETEQGAESGTDNLAKGWGWRDMSTTDLWADDEEE